MELLESKTENKVTVRQSNMELLRIIAMILIVAHHFSVHSGFSFATDAITVNKLWVQFTAIGGKIGVDIFVLISGYFLISAKSLKTNKVIKLWAQLFTYSILMFALFVALGTDRFGITELIKRCLPVTFTGWWFASTYFVLYLISPFINKLLNTLSKKEYQHFLILLTVCWCIIPTLTDKNFESNNLLWFIYLYSLAGYIKLHIKENSIKGSPANYLLLSALLTVLTFLSTVLFDEGIRISLFANYANYYYGMQKLPILAISVLTFIGFSRINIGYSRIINVIASATFGVYLIHDHSSSRPFIWQRVFSCASYSESKFLIPYSLLVIAFIYIACTVIELLRIYLFEKHYMKLINSLAGVIDKCKEKLFSLSFFDRF